jgi:hypothetical protein
MKSLMKACVPRIALVCLIIGLIFGNFLGLLNQVQAAPATYDKNAILCDRDFDFSNSLDESEIQAIFVSRNSFFKNYVDPTTTQRASWVIADRARYYQISSRVLLAKMQAESSSVWAYRDMNAHIHNDAGIDMGARADWVLFYGWSDTTIFPQYKGFYKQVDNAAKSLSEWFANPESMGWVVGEPHPVSDGTVTPTNKATAALYIYTPWISSNKLLYDVWKMMFGNTGICGLDLIFAIDTTGSMWDDIDNVKAYASMIVNEIDDKVSEYRIAVVDYRDFPVYPYGAPGDYPFHDDLAFSTDKSSITTALQSLTLGNGVDWDESVYSALMHSIDATSLGGWRGSDKAEKVIILLGDAPPHDPEPFTGYTASTVIAEAEAADPVSVYAISIGGDPTTYDSFSGIAEGTGGKVFTAETAEDVVEAIISAIGEIVTPSLGVTVDIEPDSIEVNPSQQASYAVTLTNTGSEEDTYDISVSFNDFNGAFRAYPTSIQPTWVTIADISLTIGSGESKSTALKITVPSDWAGIEEATYTFEVRATSKTDSSVSNSDSAILLVKNIKRSMAEYIKLEITWLSAKVDSTPIEQGVKNGLLVKLNAALAQMDKAISQIADGNEKQANNALNSAENILNAFTNLVEAQNNKKVTEPDADMLIDWANNVIADIDTAKITGI